MTRLDIMTYLDPVSTPGSKPQRLRDENGKGCTWKQNNKFWHFLQTSDQKPYIQEKKSFNLF